MYNNNNTTTMIQNSSKCITKGGDWQFDSSLSYYKWTSNEQRLVVVVEVVVVLLLSWNIVGQNYPCPKWQVSENGLMMMPFHPWPPDFCAFAWASSWLLPDIWTLSPLLPTLLPHPLWNVGLGFSRGGSPTEDFDLNVSKDIILCCFCCCSSSSLGLDLGLGLTPSELLTQEKKSLATTTDWIFKIRGCIFVP
jgi:hypothetical protein